jgi:hypothetical protein
MLVRKHAKMLIGHSRGQLMRGEGRLLQGLVSSLVGFELGVLRIGKPNSRCS